MSKDDVKKYPVMTLDELPAKLIPWVDKRINVLESNMNKKIEDSIKPCAKTAIRQNNHSAAIRVLYLLVVSIIISMFITGC